MNTALILGASTGVGRALTESIAKYGWNLILCSRSKRDIESNAANVYLRYEVKPTIIPTDLNNKNERDKLISFILNKNEIKYILITVGEVINNDDGLQDPNDIDKLLNSNFISIIHFLSGIIREINRSEEMNIVFLSSIAITRPRKNNLAYAASKSAVDFYCRGLQHLLVNTSIKIKIFRLGYIDTTMTYGRKLLFPAASSKSTAEFILSKLNKRKRIFYYPKYWRHITFLIKLVPWIIYKKFSF